jgi:hypothetical protein
MSESRLRAEMWYSPLEYRDVLSASKLQDRLGAIFKNLSRTMLRAQNTEAKMSRYLTALTFVAPFLENMVSELEARLSEYQAGSSNKIIYISAYNNKGAKNWNNVRWDTRYGIVSLDFKNYWTKRAVYEDHHGNVVPTKNTRILVEGKEAEHGDEVFCILDGQRNTFWISRTEFGRLIGGDEVLSGSAPIEVHFPPSIIDRCNVITFEPFPPRATLVTNCEYADRQGTWRSVAGFRTSSVPQRLHFATDAGFGNKMRLTVSPGTIDGGPIYGLAIVDAAYCEYHESGSIEYEFGTQDGTAFSTITSIAADWFYDGLMSLRSYSTPPITIQIKDLGDVVLYSSDVSSLPYTTDETPISVTGDYDRLKLVVTLRRRNDASPVFRGCAISYETA